MNSSQSKPLILCDAMLGSLCRWLRFFGIDSEYAGVEADDSEIGVRAEDEGRWLLTADRELAGRGPKTMLVRSLTLDEQLIEVLMRMRLEVSPDLRESRCSHCNGQLVAQCKRSVAGEVPRYVLNTVTNFTRCRRCKRVFWSGTHSEKILERMQSIVDRLEHLRGAGDC